MGIWGSGYMGMDLGLVDLSCRDGMDVDRIREWKK